MSTSDYNQPFLALEEMALFSAIDPTAALKFGKQVRAYPLSNRSYWHRFDKLATENRMKDPPRSSNHIMPGFLVVRKLGTPQQYETWMPEDVFEELYK